MKNFWINKNNGEKLIVFFNGAGMNEKSVQHVSGKEFDVILFYDCENTETNKNIFEEINEYKEIHLIGWSMGVLICTLFADKIKNTASKIAIAGTPYPVSNIYGIREKTYDTIVNNFDEATKSALLRNAFAVNKSKFITKSAEGIKKELILQRNQKPAITFFDKAIIPLHDKIIPTQNQINYWNTQQKTKQIRIDCGHYPFFLLRNWNNIIQI